MYWATLTTSCYLKIKGYCGNSFGDDIFFDLNEVSVPVWACNAEKQVCWKLESIFPLLNIESWVIVEASCSILVDSPIHTGWLRNDLDTAIIELRGCNLVSLTETERLQKILSELFHVQRLNSNLINKLSMEGVIRGSLNWKGSEKCDQWGYSGIINDIFQII